MSVTRDKTTTNKKSTPNISKVPKTDFGGTYYNNI